MYFLIRKTSLSTYKILSYLLYAVMIMSSLVLWILFDVTDYGLEKLLNFLLITILFLLL